MKKKARICKWCESETDNTNGDVVTLKCETTITTSGSRTMVRQSRLCHAIAFARNLGGVVTAMTDLLEQHCKITDESLASTPTPSIVRSHRKRAKTLIVKTRAYNTELGWLGMRASTYRA